MEISWKFYINLKTFWAKKSIIYSELYRKFVNNGFVIIVMQLRVISEIFFCVETESELRTGLSRQDFEIRVI